MTTYHVNADGNVGVCRATKNPCPYDAQMHTDNREDAEQYANEYMEERFGLELYPRQFDPSFVRRQAELYWDQDQSFGGAGGVYARQGVADAEKLRFEDYAQGFTAAYATNDPDAEPAFENRWADRRTEHGGLYDSTAFQLGYARALRSVKPIGSGEKGWLDHHIADYEVDAYKGANGKYDYVRVLGNPFKDGEEVLIPAKTKYRQGKEIKETTAPQRVKITQAQRSYASGAVGRVLIHPTEITYAATKNGQWRTIVLTPEFLSANGKETFEVPPIHEDLYLTPLYADIRQWKDREQATA